MSKIQTIKKTVGEKPTFGTDPKDPWSAKANIAEDAALNQYLISRGINPKHVTKDQKVAHSKMGQFLKWKRDHLGEAVDKKDTVTFDIPLLIRVLEFAREDLKSDILLHKMVERLISMRGKGTLTMDQYGRIIKEEAEALGESEYGPRADKLLKHSHDLYHKSRSEADPEKKQSMVKMSTKAHKVFMKAKEQHFKRNPDAYKAHVNKMMSGAAQDYKDQEKKRGIGHVRDQVEVDSEVVQIVEVGDTKKGQKLLQLVNKRAVDRVTSKRADTDPVYAKKAQQTHLAANDRLKEESDQIDEVSSELLDRYKKGAMKSAADLAAKGDYKKSNDRLLGHMKATGKQIDKTTAAIKKSLRTEAMDPKAADPLPADGANSPADVAPKKKKQLIQMSKSARIIKSIYKKKGVKEEPKAAAVLSGGTTMTGEKRDTIEIDPMMKKGRPQ